MTPVERFVRHEAELDALAYFQRIHESDPEAALRFLRAIDETVEGLVLQPFKGRLRRFRGKDLAHVRSWRVDGFEVYLIFYRFTGSRLEVLRVRHGGMRFPRSLRRP